MKILLDRLSSYGLVEGGTSQLEDSCAIQRVERKLGEDKYTQSQKNESHLCLPNLCIMDVPGRKEERKEKRCEEIMTKNFLM